MHRDNHDRRNLGINRVLAGRARHGTCLDAACHGVTALATELVQTFPLGNVCRCCTAEALQMAFKRTERAVAAELVTFRNFGQVRIAQEISVPVNANQVMAFALRKLAHSRNGKIITRLLE